MSKLEYILAAAHNRLERARELLVAHEELVARMRGLDGDAPEQVELLRTLRKTVVLFEDDVLDLMRRAAEEAQPEPVALSRT